MAMVFVLGTEGKDKGCLVISKDGANDGKYILDEKDAHGTPLYARDGRRSHAHG